MMNHEQLEHNELERRKHRSVRISFQCMNTTYVSWEKQ